MPMISCCFCDDAKFGSTFRAALSSSKTPLHMHSWLPAAVTQVATSPVLPQLTIVGCYASLVEMELDRIASFKLDLRSSVQICWVCFSISVVLGFETPPHKNNVRSRSLETIPVQKGRREELYMYMVKSAKKQFWSTRLER
jgi:hypothetical protein